MPATPYLNFDLLLQRQPDSYRAAVIESPVGQAACEFRLPWTAEELQRFLQTFFHTALQNRSGHLRHFHLVAGQAEEATTPLDLQSFGQSLFQAVFAGDLDTSLMRSLDEASRQQARLRIRIRIDANAPELAELPWEFLYGSHLARFLALSNQTSIVRYVPLGQPEKPLRVAPPLRALTIVTDPKDLAALDVEQEWRRLQQATASLVERGALVLDRLAAPTLAALRQYLRQHPVHMLHFIGHGFFDPATDTGGLLFENEDGDHQIVRADVLAMNLHDHPSLRLIFLNACEGARSDEDNFFAGIAQHLVQQGIPAVIAMQFAVSDRAALALVQEFYQTLADGYPVDAALSEARKVLYEQQPESAEWGVPVLYMRTGDGALWQTGQAPSKRSARFVRRLKELAKQPKTVALAALLLVACLAGAGWLWRNWPQASATSGPAAAAVLPPGDCVTPNDYQASVLQPGWRLHTPGQPLTASAEARSLARQEQVQLLLWGHCTDGQVNVNFEIFPNSRQYGVIELETLVVSVTPNTLRRIGDIAQALSRYLQYDGANQVESYSDIAQRFGRLAEAVAPDSLPAAASLCDAGAEPGAGEAAVSAEWAALTYLAATSNLFAHNYAAAIQQYDQIRQSYPPLALQAQNNLGVASVNLAAFHWQATDATFIENPQREALCAFNGLVQAGLAAPGDVQPATVYVAQANLGMTYLYFDLIRETAPVVVSQMVNRTEAVASCQAARPHIALGDLCLSALLLDEARRYASTSSKNILASEELLGAYEQRSQGQDTTLAAYWRAVLVWLIAGDEPNNQKKSELQASAVDMMQPFACATQPPFRLSTDLLLLEFSPALPSLVLC
jgi:hypothetical protein